MQIHETALVEKGARLANDVIVGPFAYIADDVILGSGTRVGPHAVIHSYTTLGKNCRLHAGAVVGDLPQDLGFKDLPSRVLIGDNCVMREGVTIHRGTEEESETRVGRNCYLMANSHLAHNVQLGAHSILANGALLGGRVVTGERIFVSGNAAVHQFVKIGRLAMIGGNASLSKDLPPFCIASTGRRNAVGGLNVVGMRRANIGPAERKQIKAVFKAIYRSNLNVNQALKKISKGNKNPYVEEFSRFIKESERGICSLEK